VQPPGVGGTLEEARLLERTQQLAVIEACFAEVRDGSSGCLVLVRGEAGSGKTAAVRHFCHGRLAPSVVLWGRCEPLFTPRPLAPFVEIAELTRGKLEQLARYGATPHQVLEALAEEAAKGCPTVIVLEDLHWADEATLDVLRLVGRRIDAFPGLVVATYRDDELEQAPRLRIVLGELARIPGVERLELARLSLRAVAELAEPYEVDGAEVYRRTAGNPFFVCEALAAGTDVIPETVRDAVLARAAGLDDRARMLLEALAVIPAIAELSLLRTIAGDAIEALDQCLGCGIVVWAQAGVMFRHELARTVIEESTPPNRRLELHARALRALDGSDDYARLAHHAEAANDEAAVVLHAPEAALQAAKVGAHHESAAQYLRALRFAQTTSAPERARLLHARAYQCKLTDQIEEAVAAANEALALRRELGDVRGQAETLILLSDTLWCPGRVAESHAAADEALEILQGVDADRQLAGAYATVADLCIDTEDVEAMFGWAARALELARAADDRTLEIGLEITVAIARFLKGDHEGRRQLELIRARAVEADLEEQACWVDHELVWLARRQRDYARASAYLEPAIRYAGDRGMELFRGYLLAHRAQIELDLGRWDEAGETAALVLSEPLRSRIPKIVALAVVGRLRARRGDPEVWPALDEARSLANVGELLAASEPVAAARAEAAWLAGDLERVERETSAELALARRCRSRWVVAELAAWRRRAGVDDQLSESELAGPYALEVAGAWQAAATRWRELGCPYEAALALAESGEPNPMRDAVQALQGLGARSAAAIFARRLREQGIRGIPRGPRSRTRENPHGLTARELEVLPLLVEGFRNSEIADRLVVSERTIDHHVSAILRKLGVRSRTEAGAEAMRLGLALAGEAAAGAKRS
jgi:ATP/maltotriose-dependent transcriptional regulator MalT